MEQTKEPTNEFGILYRIMFLFGLCVFFVACSSKPAKNFTYEPTANPVDEIRNLQTEMDRAEGEQIAVFSPESYSQANKHFSRARDLQERGESNANVLKELGLARSFFEQSKEVAASSLKALSEVANARENALIAGAALTQKNDLRKADNDLMDLTSQFEKKSPTISLQKKTELQQRYLDLELKGIKSARLGDAQSKIEGARKMGAARYAPRTLAQAEAKLKNAELVINTDRHNDALVTAASGDALNAANRLVKVTDLSKKSGRRGNEDYALGIVTRDEEIAALNAKMMQEEAARKAQQQQLEQQRLQAESQYQRQLMEARQSAQQARESASVATSRLERQRQIEQMYRQAQAQFASSEADVYRQGDNLILRLKSIKFPSGGADVPSASYKTLNKVRDVIQNLNAGRVIVEGHTDSTGSAEKNKDLSQQRAESVAQYLESDAGRRSGGAGAAGAGANEKAAPVQAPQVEAVGYGFEHPIVSNKTKSGRAQNRRVDIVITPEMVVQ